MYHLVQRPASSLEFATGHPLCCALLPVLSNMLPVTDEPAKRSVRFVQTSSDSYAVRFIANYCVFVGSHYLLNEENILSRTFLCGKVKLTRVFHDSMKHIAS